MHELEMTAESIGCDLVRCTEEPTGLLFTPRKTKPGTKRDYSQVMLNGIEDYAATSSPESRLAGNVFILKDF